MESAVLPLKGRVLRRVANDPFPEDEDGSLELCT